MNSRNEYPAGQMVLALATSVGGIEALCLAPERRTEIASGRLGLSFQAPDNHAPKP